MTLLWLPGLPRWNFSRFRRILGHRLLAAYILGRLAPAIYALGTTSGKLTRW